MAKTSYIVLSIYFCCLAGMVVAQEAQFNLREIEKSLAKVSEKLYFSRNEVDNKQYRAFLDDLQKNGAEDVYQSAAIDSTQWIQPFTYNQPYVTYYHTHPAYDAYPVVNVSRTGADLYCQWLTKKYNNNKKRKHQEVLFRLPTEQEWMQAASAGKSTAIYAWEGDALQTDDGAMRANFRIEAPQNLSDLGSPQINADVTAPVISYWPNGFGLYNMSGNVAEMVSDAAYVKGGSWADGADALRLDAKGREVSDPAAMVGFRVVMEVIEE